MVSVKLEPLQAGGFQIAIAVSGATPAERALEWDEAFERARKMIAALEHENRVFATVERPQVLSRREREVAELVAQGLSNKEIGRRLTIEAGTVESHVRRINKALGTQNRVQIANALRKQ